MKYIMKKTALLCALLILCMSLFGCGEAAAPAQVVSDADLPHQGAVTEDPIRVYAISGPTGMGLVQLMDASDNGTAKGNYTFSLTTAPADIVGKLTSGQADIAAIPANLAATLYAKTNGNIQVLALNTLSNLYIVQTEEEQLTLAGLAGKTIAMAGQGSTPEYVLKYILEANGLTDKVTIQYYSEHSEVLSQLAAGKETIALLPQPFVTVAQDKLEDLIICVNVGDAWEATDSNAAMVMGCVVARKDFVEQNKDAVDLFLQEYLNSISYVSIHTEETAALVAKYGIMASAELAEEALPSCGVAYISGATMRDALKPFLEILYEANPAAVGGALPDDGFYYIP